MKSKIMIKNIGVGLVTLFLMMLSSIGYSQACPGNNVTVTLQNFTQPTTSSIEFDVFISNTGTTTLLLGGMQGGVIHNTGFLPAGATGTFTAVVQPSATGNFPGFNVTGPAYTPASRQMRWSNTPVTLNSGNTIELPANTPLRFARFRFTSSLPFTQNFAGVLTPQFAVQGGFTNVLATVYCNGNPNSAGLGSATTGTLTLPSPYNVTLNPLTDICFTSGAASNLTDVTCFGGNNGSATITMSPTPSSLSATYSVDGGASTPVTLTAGGAFSVSGLTVGAHTITVTGSGACTTPVNVPVTISGPTSQPTNTTNQTACDSFTWSVTGQTYTSSGTYNGTSTDVNGCTVNEVLNLTINNSTSSTTTETACDTYTWAANGQTYTSSGTYTHVTTNGAGCPDTATLVLTINNSTSSTTTITACDTYTWAANGQTYTSSGTYTHVTTNGAGCPDTATLVLTINNSTSSTTTITACDTYTWAANGQTYTTSGTYTFVGTNGAGCPDTATLVLTINNSTSSTTTETACDTYTWAANGQTYTTSGTYTHVTTNGAGCPDTATLVLTINNSTSSTLNITSSTPYTWAANGQTYASSGTYTFVSTNAAGCTFTQTLNLTIATGPTTVISPAQCGITFATINTQVIANLVPGAQAYRWEITDTVTNQVQLLDTVLRTMYLTNLNSYAFNRTYSIRVAVRIAGVWQAFGTSCSVTTPVATTQVQTSQCGDTLVLMSDAVYADNVAYASGYRFRITNLVTSAQVIADRPNRAVVLTAVSGFTPEFNTTYSIEVAVKNTDGTYMPYGAACNVTTPAFPTSQLQASQCDVTISNMNTTVYADSYSGASTYRFKFTSGSYTYTFDRPTRSFVLSSVPGVVAGNVYSVQVSLEINGVFGPYGKVCTITIPGAGRTNSNVEFQALAYPNPYAENFMLDVKTVTEEVVQVRVYDMLGKQVEDRKIDVDSISNVEFGSRYPSGVYNVIVSQGDSVKTLRVIKR